jgi:hypothetical protein
MGIPPQAARLAGLWAVQTTAPRPQPHPTRRDRSRRIDVARLLQPLHGPVPPHQSSLPAQPAPPAPPVRPA